MDLEIVLGIEADINQLEILYNDLNDYLQCGTNYPGWKKDVYPIREDAVAGVKDNNLYVAKQNGKIIGSIILNHKPESAYEKVRWQIDMDYSNVFVVHTFVVHPDYMKCGVGKILMDYSIQLAKQSGIKSIRLDVYENNIPAIKLYEKCGFTYIDTIDLGLGQYGLHWFKVYEKLI